MRQRLLVKLIFGIFAIAINGCRQYSNVTPPVTDLSQGLNTRSADRQPNFSHDGAYLVFSSDRNSSRNVLLYDVRQKRLLPLPGLNQLQSMQYQPAISGDGRYIVYVSEQYGAPNILLYDRSEQKIQNITQDFVGEVRNPTISGNGRFIAFETNRSGQWDIQVYDRGSF